MTSEPADPIDVRNNPESRAAASSRASVVARASDGGSPPREAPATGDLPEAEEGGAAEGNPVAGVTISEADAEAAVQGDDGPDGSTPRSSAGHA